MPYPVQGAALAPMTTGVFSAAYIRRLAILITAIAIAISLLATVAPQATDARATPRTSEADRVLMYARSHLGARFRMGTEGMRYFDCSGLIYRVFQQAHLLRRIGGTRMLAAQYFRWFKQRGLVSKGNPKPGDLIWWTKKGHIEHIGMYYGDGRAISALINPWGVKRHGVKSIHLRFLAFGHVRLDR